MRINSVSPKSFGQIYFDNQNLEYGLCLDIKKSKPNERRKILELVRKNIRSNYLDIYVTENEDVLIRDRVTHGKTSVIGKVPLYSKFKAALGYAEIKERKQEHI